MNLKIFCKTHSDAPHGFMRDASHSAGRYVCECEIWEPPKDEAITALRQALETEKQEPVCWTVADGWVYPDDTERVDESVKTEHEPVAWANSFDLQNFDMKVRTGPDLNHTVPLYTAPTKREWVGLTDEEIQDLGYLSEKFDASNSEYFDRWGFAQAIEAKLKEKNHG